METITVGKILIDMLIRGKALKRIVYNNYIINLLYATGGKLKQSN